MLRVLEKYWPAITILSFIALVVVILLQPAMLPFLAVPLLIFGTGIAILLVVHKEVDRFQAHKIDRAGLSRNISIETAGILTAIGVAAFLATPTSFVIEAFVSTKREDILLTLVIAMLTGLGIGSVIQFVTGKFVK